MQQQWSHRPRERQSEAHGVRETPCQSDAVRLRHPPRRAPAHPALGPHARRLEPLADLATLIPDAATLREDERLLPPVLQSRAA